MAQDPVKVDSEHYTVELENDRVRVLRIRYGPHEESVMHSHPAVVGVMLTDGQFRFSYPGGKSEDVTAKAGQVLYFDAVEHLPANVSDQPFEVIGVELKRGPAGAAKPAKAKAAARPKAKATKKAAKKRPSKKK